MYIYVKPLEWMGDGEWAVPNWNLADDQYNATACQLNIEYIDEEIIQQPIKKSTTKLQNCFVDDSFALKSTTLGHTYTIEICK